MAIFEKVAIFRNFFFFLKMHPLKKLHFLNFPLVFGIGSIKQKWLEIEFYLLGPIFNPQIVFLSNIFLKKLFVMFFSLKMQLFQNLPFSIFSLRFWNWKHKRKVTRNWILPTRAHFQCPICTFKHRFFLKNFY